MGLGMGVSPIAPQFGESSVGTGGSRPWQGTLRQGSCAHATRVTTPRALSPPTPSFSWGGGWRRQVPRATRVTRGTLPLSQPSAVSAALAWTYATI